MQTATFAQSYATDPYAAYVRSRRQLGDTGASLTEISQPRGDFPDPPNSDLVVAVSMRRAPVSARIAHRRFRHENAPGALVCIPPGNDTDVTIDAANRFLVLAIPAKTAANILAAETPSYGLDFGRLHEAPFEDEVVATLLQRLAAHRDAAAPPSALAIDSALSRILLALAHAGGRPRAREDSGALSPARLARAIEFMTSVEPPPSLRAIAAHVGLSPSRFCRAFKASTCLPPHRFLTSTRIERVKGLLSTGAEQAEIAATCGFSSQQHMASVFKAVVGMPPGAWRRAREL